MDRGTNRASPELARQVSDEAAYFTFEFPEEMDSMMAKEYRLGL